MSPFRLATVTVVAASALTFARAASAQAFPPPAGEGNVSVTYQNLLARGHLDLNGDRMAGPSGTDPVQTHSMMWAVDFGVSDRLAVDLSLPFIGSKYGGSAPHLVGGVGPPQEWDDGSYHGTFQDFQVGVRYKIATRPVTITPFAQAIIPSHHYPSLAHAAVGKDLRALAIGSAVGGFLDRVLPGMFFQTQYSYTVAQEVLEIRPNRSRLDAEVGYFLTPRLAVRFFEGYQVTHHGIDLISFASPMTDGIVHDHPEISGAAFTAVYRRQHDRLQRSNFLNFGGGVNFAVNDSLDVFAAAAKMVWGENIHPLRGVSIGVNWHFRLHGGPRRPSQTGNK